MDYSSVASHYGITQLCSYSQQTKRHIRELACVATACRPAQPKDLHRYQQSTPPCNCLSQTSLFLMK